MTGSRPGSQTAGPTWARSAAGVVVVALAAWGALQWTLIPTALDTVIVDSTWSEAGPPLKEVHTSDGAVRTVDSRLYERLGGAEGSAGVSLRKEAWSRTLEAGGEDVPLSVGWTSWKPILMVVGLVVAALVRHRRIASAASARLDASTHHTE